jgi:hypothetical protein
MRRAFAWAALAATAIIAIYGFVHEHLFSQWVWTEEGYARLAGYAAVYWIAAIAILRIRPALFFWATSIFVFGYSTWWCAVYFHWWAPLATLYFLGSCQAMGRIFSRGIVAGLAIWVFLISIAAHFPVNRLVVYAIAFALPYFRGLNLDFKMPAARWQHAFLGFVLLAHWLLALKPEASSDGLAMHLAIPSMIADHARFAFDIHQYTWSVMPMGGDFAFTAAYLTGGEAAARLLNFALLCVLIAMVYRIAQRWLAEPMAALAAALFASTPLAELVTGSLFVENVWAVFIAGAAVAIVESDLAGAGLLLGAALATKIGTSAYLLPMAIAGAFHLKKHGRAAIAGMALLVVFASPPYVSAWMKTGNPLFPFENQIFRSPDFDQKIPLEDVRYMNRARWSALYTTTFRSSAHSEGQDGALGFQYFLFLPAMLILWNRRAPGALIAIGLAGAAITFVPLPNLRYVYPALPLVSMGIAWLISEIRWLAAAAVALIALNVYFFDAAGWYHKAFAIFTRAQWDEYMRVSAPQRELVGILNRTAPGEPVAFVRGGVIAGLHAMGYSDTWHTYRFWRRMIEAQETAQVAEEFREDGIHWLITPAPCDSRFEIVRRFVGEWTVPAGAASGNFELRKVTALPLAKRADVQPAGAGTIDDRDPRVDFTGAWQSDQQFKRAFAGSITYSNVPGDSAKLFFAGTEVAYVYTKALNRGTAEVWIDRKRVASIDEYSKNIEWQQRTVFSGLAPGPHTIEVRVGDVKNRASQGLFVDVDGFVVK